VVHLIDVVPDAPCWGRTPLPAEQQLGSFSQLDNMKASVPATKTAAPLSTTLTTTAPTALVISPKLYGSCSQTLDGTLQRVLGAGGHLLREALKENGLAERLDHFGTSVTVFAPTGDALKHWMRDYNLTEEDLILPGWTSGDCVQNLFKYMVHPTSLGNAELQQWVTLNGGEFQLPTLCGEACSPGLTITSRSSTHVNGAALASSGASFCNGVVHVVTKMPIPPDWAPRTTSCKRGLVSPQPQQAMLAVSAFVPFVYPPPPEPEQLILGMNIVWAAVGSVIVGVTLLGSIAVVTCFWRKRKVDKVVPELHVLAVRKDKLSDPNKKQKKFMDCEKAGIEALDDDLDSEPSTRCPSKSSANSTPTSVVSSYMGFSRCNSNASLYDGGSSQGTVSVPTSPQASARGLPVPSSPGRFSSRELSLQVVQPPNSGRAQVSPASRHGPPDSLPPAPSPPSAIQRSVSEGRARPHGASPSMPTPSSSGPAAAGRPGRNWSGAGETGQRRSTRSAERPSPSSKSAQRRDIVWTPYLLQQRRDIAQNSPLRGLAAQRRAHQSSLPVVREQFYQEPISSQLFKTLGRAGR